jgi:trimeric autotransporter adhesin
MKTTTRLHTYLLAGMMLLATAEFSSAQSWSLTGNAGTNAATNFVGTTDAINLKFRTNNLIRMNITTTGKVAIGNFTPAFKLDVKSGSINTDSVYRINGHTIVATPGTGNLAIGRAALKLNTNRFDIVAVGDSTLYTNGVGASFSDEAVNNTAVGAKALKNNTKGGSCTAVGYHALYTSTEGFYNTAVGANALLKNTTGGINVAIGSRSLQNNTTGGGNTAVGESTLFSNTTGSYNVAMGHGTLQSNIDGSSNTALGDFCMPINTTGFNNTAVGLYSMYHNISGSDNTGVGQSSLYHITTGTENVALGSYALNDITTATQNTAIGVYSLQGNNGNYNTAVGYKSMQTNTSGSFNTAVGFWSLQLNTNGAQNVAMGNYSLVSNTGGSNNTAAGYTSLYNNTTGSGNTAFGFSACSNTSLNSNCTYLGNDADNTSTTSYTNSTALGNTSRLTADNLIVLGNTSITSIKAAVTSITAISDGRFKKNIKEDVTGLDFIRQLRPVTYTLDVRGMNKFLHVDYDQSQEKGIAAKEKIVQTGFIAQEVEAAAAKIGYDFSGVDKPQNKDDFYGIRYAEFVVPLVKAVQEIDAKTSEIEKLKNEIEAIKSVLTPEQRLKLNNTASEKGVSLYQNNPNPFTEKTTIAYYIPQTVTSAVIKVYSLAGVELKSVNISDKGLGYFEIKAGELSAGTYTYMLIADGKTVDTKQMVITK